MTQNAFNRLNTTPTRYAVRGQLAISLHIGKRCGLYRETQNAAQPGPPERGKPGPRTNRKPIHFYPDKCFFSPRNASTHHDMMIRTPPPFPGPRFPAIAARGPRFSRFPVPLDRVCPLSKRIYRRLLVYCPLPTALYYLRKYTNQGGRGSAPTAVVFLYYHHTPHEIFRNKRLTATHTPPIVPRLACLPLESPPVHGMGCVNR